MDRKEFLKLIGGTAAVFTVISCLESCTKKTSSPSAPSVNFTLNLNDPANSSLNQNGGYVYNSGVIIARTTSGTYIAVSQACTHAGVSVQYQGSGFYCPAHGSTFSASGAVTGGPAPSGLKVYNTSFSGSTLHVWG
jgi:cytochrome b6-f complex iron-sulfur subunit